jgi:ketosteroid isomerase-like protein
MPTVRELWDALYAAIDAGDDQAVLRVCSEDVEIRTPGHREKRGAATLLDLFAQQRGLYVDLEHKVDSVVESADGLALSAELTLSGVPKGTDQRLTWNVVETIRADNGRLVSWHAMLDRTGLVQQIQQLHAGKR